MMKGQSAHELTETCVTTTSSSSIKPVNHPIRIIFPLTGNNVLEIKLQRKVSRSDFERILRLISLAESSLVEPAFFHDECINLLYNKPYCKGATSAEAVTNG